MTALEELELRLSEPLARCGFVLTQKNTYDRVYELYSDPGTMLQFSKTAFHVYKGTETIKEFTSNVFLPNFLAQMPVNISLKNQIY